MDGGNTLYGGCSEKHIKTFYDAIVKASGGAPVVGGAEVSPYPMQVLQYYNRTFRTDLETRMHDVTRMLDVKDSWAADYADCRDVLGGPCDDPPAYRFLNYGFLMGPAAKLAKFVEAVYKQGGFDQVAAHKYFLEHPEEVTLDYAGALSLSLHNMAEDKQSLISVAKGGFGNKKKTIKNKVTGQVQCFVHGNGNGENFVQRLAAEMA